MKKLLITAICTLYAFLAFSNPVRSIQKPRIMVVPEETFCINEGYYKMDSRGNKVPDYISALLNDDVMDVVNTFENQMSMFGFPLTNLQQALNDLKDETTLSMTLRAKDDGVIVEDDLEKLSRVAKADILVKIAPVITPFGPQKQIKLRVSSIDCASGKAIQSFGPIVKTSAGSTSQLLKSAITDNIEIFATGLSNYFVDIKENGREGSIILKVSDSCPLNLESDILYEGHYGELADLIIFWVSENSVNGAYSGGKSSRYGMKIDQVRIPLIGKSVFGKEKSLSMEDFVKTGLVQLLSNYGMSVSTFPVGIGKVYITLGALQ